MWPHFFPLVGVVTVKRSFSITATPLSLPHTTGLDIVNHAYILHVDDMPSSASDDGEEDGVHLIVSHSKVSSTTHALASCNMLEGANRRRARSEEPSDGVARLMCASRDVSLHVSASFTALSIPYPCLLTIMYVEYVRAIEAERARWIALSTNYSASLHVLVGQPYAGTVRGAPSRGGVALVHL